MKSPTRRIVTLALAALLLGSASIAPAQDARKAKLGHSFADAHPRAVAMKQFAAGVAKATNGKVLIDVYGSSMLGSEEKMLIAVSQLKAKGMTVTGMPPAELDKIRSAVQPVLDKNSEAIGKDFVQAVYGELQKFRAARR